MGWIRTALSMISFGFTIGKLGEVMDHIEVKVVLHIRTLSIKGVADFLVILGTVSLGAAVWQHWRRIRALSAMGFEHPMSLPLAIGLVLTLMGVFVLTALVMSL
jgi:putative membrane protein